MKWKADIMDAGQVDRSLARIAHEIIEHNNGGKGICLVGIRRRGVPLARMLAADIRRFEGTEVPVGEIDVRLYRDDLTELHDLPETGSCEIPADLKETTIILVDDVLYTGRTVRAAIDAVFRQGRPQAVQLAVLIDRGHRELPIRPDYVGKNIPTSRSEVVSVMVMEYDGRQGVSLQTV